MNVGFACMVLGKEKLKTKSCILKNAEYARLLEILNYNLDVLDRQIDYLISKNLHLFRISSSLVPFASHPKVKFDWQNLAKDKLKKIGIKAKTHHIRLSMHPGQYTILNSKNEDLTYRSILDVNYHAKVLDLLDMPLSNKVIVHIGGVYGDKSEAKKQFIKNFITLKDSVKSRLAIENDDKSFNMHDVLEISAQTSLPVVFDYLHFLLNHNYDEIDPKTAYMHARSTFKRRDGRQKIHYSQQAISKKLGSHSDTIDIAEFLKLKEIILDDTDVMFEVKDKNLSVEKYYSYIKSTKNFVKKGP